MFDDVKKGKKLNKFIKEKATHQKQNYKLWEINEWIGEFKEQYQKYNAKYNANKYFLYICSDIQTCFWNFTHLETSIRNLFYSDTSYNFFQLDLIHDNIWSDTVWRFL